MKKIGAILMAVMLLLLAGCALAEQSTVARNGSLAAYLDGEGHLYLPGNEKPINAAVADALVSIDPYRVLFMSTRSDGTKDLYMIDFDGFRESLIVKNVYDACMADEDTLYYVPGNDRTQLMRMDMSAMAAKQACVAAEPIDRMYNSAEGLVFEQVDGTGTMIYNRLTGKFDSYLGALPRSGMRTDSHELYLTDGDLYIRDLTSLVSEHVDSGVQTYAVMDGRVYYLCSSGGATRLKCYDPAAMTWQVVMILDSAMERQLTASADRLFMLDYRGQIYTVDLESGELKDFAKAADTSTYNIPKDYVVTDLRIEAMDGQLNLYAELEDASAQPGFSFIEFTSTSDSSMPVVRLLERYAIKGEEAAWTWLKPAVQYAPLARGSRGDAVRAIQRPLYDLGYYDYYVDGIFGPRTQFAVRLLQSDLNRPVTGIADSELQRIILEGGLPKYDAYMALTRGNRGLRVQMMQEELRDLGYLADAADGIFGANTQRAVQLFQSENGLDISDGATRATLKRLYSGAAARCASFIDLYPGYTGCRVRELNDRLQDLYYLEYNPGGSYTFDTAEAVRAFQRCAGLPVNGNATAGVLRKLFSRYAPEAPGYITLRRGDENTRVEALQLRLRKLNYYSGALDGYFGKTTEKAVKLFQKKVGLNVTGVATVRTQRLLFSNDAPIYVKPTKLGVPVVTVERYDTQQDGIYYITEDSASGGFAVFSWYAEGEVKEYRVEVVDDEQRVLLNQKTMLTRTGVSLAALELNRLYAMTVTAYPEDGNKKHITEETILFMYVEKKDTPPTPVIGTVSDPEIFIKTVLRTQGGVQYVQPGEVVFHWHAEGDVERYYVEVISSGGDVLMTVDARAEQASMKTARLTLGELYTLFVYAVPTNGTIEDATIAAELFALEDISVPTPTPEPEEPYLTPEPLVTIAPPVISEPMEARQPLENPDAPEEVPAQPVEAEIPAEAQEPPVEAEVPEPVPEPVAVEAPEDVQEQPAEAEAPVENVPEPEPAAESVPESVEIADAITPPALSFETTLDQRDGVTYVADDVLIMQWQSEGDVAEYAVEVVDSAGVPQASTTTPETAIAVRQGNLQEGEVYTLNVTAIPEGAGAEAGVSASAQFALYREEVPAEEVVPEEIVPEEVVSEEVIPEEPIPEEIIPEEVIPEEVIPEESIPEVVVPEEPVPEEVVPEEVIPEEIIPEEVVPAEPIPEEIIPEEIVPEEVIPTEPIPEEIVPEEVIPAEPILEEIVPEEVIPEEPIPEEVIPEEVIPEEVVPEEVIPEEPIPEEVIPEEFYPEEGYPEEGPGYDDYGDAPIDGMPETAGGAASVAMDAETTAMVQNVLVSWGWLTPEGFQPGVPDEATWMAVSNFENYFNLTYGGALMSMDGMIDANTLNILLNVEGIAYPVPQQG